MDGVPASFSLTALVLGLEFQDALYRFFAERGGITCDGRFAGALDTWKPAIECLDQLAQVAKRARPVGGGRQSTHGGRGGYLSRTRVPLIFWLLSAPRKSGTMRSISSK
jgi:hypothetical protein